MDCFGFLGWALAKIKGDIDDDDDLLNKLPDDVLISYILKKLPTSDLLRMMCVSKRFKGLISQPYFLDHHMITVHHHPTQSSSSSYLLLHNDGHRNRFYICHNDHNDSTASLSSYKSVEIPYPSESISTCDLEELSSAGGVICFSHFSVSESPGTLFLWNPLIGVLKPLPPTPESWIRQPIGMAFGVGFDPSIVDIKVVKIVYWGFDGFNNFQAEAFVYTHRTKSWRTIENIIVPCIAGVQQSKSCSRVTVNGVVYWCAYKNLNQDYLPDGPDCIMGFDLVDEVFKVIELHQDMIIEEGYMIKLYTLSTYGKSLVVFLDDELGQWSMFVVNVCDSSSKITILPWEKKLTTHVVNYFKGKNVFSLVPKKFVNAREIIAEAMGISLEKVRKMVVIDVEKDEVKELSDCHLPPFSRIIDYTPSLALLDS